MGPVYRAINILPSQSGLGLGNLCELDSFSHFGAVVGEVFIYPYTCDKYYNPLQMSIYRTKSRLAIIR